MLHIDVICVGKLKEKYLKDAIDEYSKRLSKDSYVIALDLTGKQLTSEEFSKKIDDISLINSNITIIIGGSLGMTNEFLSTVNDKICFSKMTFPHQLIRVFLLEQLFRAFKISNNETYHR